MPVLYRALGRFQNPETKQRKVRVVWYTSKINKAKAEKEIKADEKLDGYDLTKKIAHKQFDLASGKAHLVEFLNENCTR